MPINWTSTLPSKALLNRKATTFVRDESGTMTIFAIAIIMMMLLVGGVGVDLMRNEMARTKAQGVLDRAVLAAADLDQTQDGKKVVDDYLAKAGMSKFTTTAVPDGGINYRKMTATAKRSTPTMFMSTLGVPSLPVSVRSEAEERIAKVEISMVLDISGSMGPTTFDPDRSDEKIVNLRKAAKKFVTTVLTEKTKDLISISLIPYSEHVNAGPLIFDQLKTTELHGYSHCIEFPDSAFDTEKLDTSITYDQVQHLQWNPGKSGTNYKFLVQDTICPQYSYERIRPVTQDSSALTKQIQSLQPRAGTSIYLGMKWATSLLDPSTRDIVTKIVGNDSPFKGRPAAYDDDDTIKTIILMTDGKNSSSNRIFDAYYDTDSEIVHWSNRNFRWFENNNWPNNYGSLDYQYMNAANANILLDNICDAAKAKGIVIWSIGFEVQSDEADIMEDCASSPSHYFDVEGLEITEAFQAIAKQINQLRLTQ